MKKGVEKIRDDLYVKKGKFGSYYVVYPLKDENGVPIKGNLKRALLSDVIGSIPMLITVAILLVMLLPGAQQIKHQCEDIIEYLQENSCEVCDQQRFGSSEFNFTIKDSLSSMETGEGVG